MSVWTRSLENLDKLGEGFPLNVERQDTSLHVAHTDLLQNQANHMLLSSLDQTSDEGS